MDFNMNTINCRLERITPYYGDVYQVILIPQSPIDFQAGQYLQVIMSENDKRPFSIASAPEVTDRIELHIGASSENQYSLEVLEKLKLQGNIDVELPLGEAAYKESERPLLFLIGGTGFSYAHSIIEHCLAQKLSKSIHLYWGVRQLEYMYDAATAKKWQASYPNITFTPVVEFPDKEWTGKSGLVHKALLEEYGDLSEYDIYIAGRFEMAKVAKNDFVAAGANEQQIYGDAFSF